MTQDEERLTGPQKTFVFFLRWTGWTGLLVVPFYAFALTAGALQPLIPVPFVLMMSALGVLAGFVLAGVAWSPSFLLRPTSFLKGLLVSLVVGVLNGLVSMQVVLMVVSVDHSVLPPSVVRLMTEWVMWMDADIARMAELGNKAGQSGVPQGFVAGVAVAFSVAFVVSLPSSLASWMALFLRFNKPDIPSRSDRERQAERQRFQDAAQREKALAKIAMRKRLAQRRTI